MTARERRMNLTRAIESGQKFSLDQRIALAEIVRTIGLWHDGGLPKVSEPCVLPVACQAYAELLAATPEDQR
jgi:hypothetical protein